MTTKEILSQKLGDLIDEKKDEDHTLSIPIQAKQMEIPYQTLKKYIDGTAECPISNLVKIAEYYNVSTDYLLGKARYRTTNKATKELCETLGLSDRAVEFAMNEENNELMNVINFLIEQNIRSEYVRSTLFKEGAITDEPYDSILKQINYLLKLYSSDEKIYINFIDGTIDFCHVDLSTDERQIKSFNLKAEYPGLIIESSVHEIAEKNYLERIVDILSEICSKKRKEQCADYDKRRRIYNAKKNSKR